MVVIRLDREADKRLGAVGCFVLNIAKLAADDIAFGSNSWRGDDYADLMDRAIEQYEQIDSSAIPHGGQLTERRTP